jgi:hypothetical protein
LHSCGVTRHDLHIWSSWGTLCAHRWTLSLVTAVKSAATDSRALAAKLSFAPLSRLSA